MQVCETVNASPTWQVPPASLAKSRLGIPCVEATILPTVPAVPIVTVTLSD